MKIHIATTIDTNYVQHLAVMLASLFENNPENDFQIHLFVDFEENTTLQKLHSFIQSSGHSVITTHLDTSQVDNLKITGHISRATYFRLLIPEFLQKHTDKVIYLDCDLLVLQDLLPLWQTDLQNFPVGAVPEISFITHDTHETEGQTFNAGVLLLDVKSWIANDLTRKALDFATHHFDKIIYWDQDVLNHVFRQNWLLLPEKWNVTSGFFEKDVMPPEIGIVHFTGSLKPWHYHCSHPLKNEYFKYLRKTLWKSFQLKENTLGHKLKQNTKRAINFLLRRKIFEIYA